MNWNDESIRFLIEGYTREPGVRQLKQLVEKIYRKCVLQQLESPTESKKDEILDKDRIRTLLGPPPFVRTKSIQGVGVVQNLSTHVQSVEATPLENHLHLQITGNMGSTMRESSQIAYSFAKYYLRSQGVVLDHVHLHIPEGATPKDGNRTWKRCLNDSIGSSAGLAMCLSLISLGLQKVVRPSLAMTGELTLTGRILPVKDIKEKLLAARRGGVASVVLPSGNKGDVEGLLDGLDAVYADSVGDVLNHVFQ